MHLHSRFAVPVVTRAAGIPASLLRQVTWPLAPARLAVAHRFVATLHVG